MQLTPTNEGLIKQHPHKDIVPKSEHHQELKHHMEHVIYKPKGQKEIMSKVRQTQKLYQHSIGKVMHYGLKTMKQKHYVKH